ncbi:hypothetical protein ACQKNB_13785 [Lysinibacillus xylanilyticus]|uniref:hypothetical protein n=1 Tax=Lysinibacillus xylanilyticus TaxID=582475 RepID=UPI003CFEC9A2
MTNIPYSVWIEAEQWEQLWNEDDDNADVVVRFEGGSAWKATFFTYQNIFSMAKKNEETGECLRGSYFWASEMILVRKITRNDIEVVIKDLLADGTFESVFKLCED